MKITRFPSGKNLNVTRHLQGRGREGNKGKACNHGDEKPPTTGQAKRTLMAAWISRTFFLAKTCMWLDTYIVQSYKRKGGKKNKKENTKETQKIKHLFFFFKKNKKIKVYLGKLFASSVSFAVKRRHSQPHTTLLAEFTDHHCSDMIKNKTF